MSKIEEFAKELFGEMRPLTKEEIALKNAYYDSISEYTGRNFFDLLEDNGKSEP
jgi:hypothetical protein